jgi:hypothetical protein
MVISGGDEGNLGGEFARTLDGEKVLWSFKGVMKEIWGRICSHSRWRGGTINIKMIRS